MINSVRLVKSEQIIVYLVIYKMKIYLVLFVKLVKDIKSKMGNAKTYVVMDCKSVMNSVMTEMKILGTDVSIV